MNQDRITRNSSFSTYSRRGVVVAGAIAGLSSTHRSLI